MQSLSIFSAALYAIAAVDYAITAVPYAIIASIVPLYPQLLSLVSKEQSGGAADSDKAHVRYIQLGRRMQYKNINLQ
jgi:hypothetical protein